MTLQQRTHSALVSLATFVGAFAAAGCDSSDPGSSGTGGGASSASTSTSTTAATTGIGGASTSSTTGNGGNGGGAGGSGAGGSGGSGVIIDTTPGVYRETCDGSAGVFIDHDHFLDANDENQVLRLYARSQDAGPVQSFEISADIGLDDSDEADVEGAARVGDRVFWVTSHGRDKNGALEGPRYRFFATDLSGVVPDVQLAVAGYSDTLLEEMLDPANWVTPHAEVIALLNARSQLGTQTVPDLAPNVNGTTIEGLAAVPTPTHPERLLIGFRNPQVQSNAIVVSLLNPDAVVSQSLDPSFGEAILLDLGGLGVRAMAYSSFHGAVLLVGGPIDDSAGPFKLYRWTGAAADPPVYVQDLVVPASSAPEAIIVFPDSKFIQVLIDQGSSQIDGEDCKDAPLGDQRFVDLIFQVD
jgi:Protein of unknown function (DUF3616)